jgi:hypothetical protein
LAKLEQLLKQELAAVDEHIRRLTERRDHLVSLMSVNSASLRWNFNSPRATIEAPSKKLRTNEMIVEILRRAHEELNAGQIASSIERDFGRQAPKTLYQMLYRNARAKKIIYKTNAGRFGLLEWKATKQRD